jgi:hypothetical protein
VVRQQPRLQPRWQTNIWGLRKVERPTHLRDRESRCRS